LTIGKEKERKKKPPAITMKVNDDDYKIYKMRKMKKLKFTHSHCSLP